MTVENLKECINQIKAAIDSISSEHKETASDKSDLSDQTCVQATQIAAAASAIADKSVEVVSQIGLNMDEIQDYSRKIADIIPIIDDIVLQTKMLAHTLAIETARAGEQAGGFAAVSVEMRNLMQRVVATGEEIKNLMDDSLNIVCDGKKLVIQAGLTVEEIVHSLHDITAMMSEISDVSAAHMACINQIDQAMGKWTI
jgi:methyl-accepting chemotaxis protein